MKKIITSISNKNLIIRNLFIALFAFVFQGLWEYLACGTFYNIQTINNMTILMFEATIGDVVITLVIFNILIIINNSVNWHMDKKDLLIIIFYAIMSALYFESRALAINRWSYSNDMLYFFDSSIGLIPVLQLVVLLPITIRIENLVFQKISKYID